jgi:hypothetical protein
MITLIRKIIILLSIILVIYLGYEAFFHNTGKQWKKYPEPQLASFTSLEKDEAILKELDSQTHYKTYKPLDPVFFVKPSIFQTIQR